jgi:glutaminase
LVREVEALSLTTVTVEETAPSRGASPVVAYLDALLARHRPLDGGEVAAYIPELASVDPTHFGICLATVDGVVYEAGDTRVPFSIQSMSKPLTYGIALECAGEAIVRDRVGVEPSGDAFNEISLAPGTGAPVNPMINAGAIACAGLVAGAVDDAFEHLLRVYTAYAGRPLQLDERVYRSEAETGHRNRAIAHLLRNFDVIVDAPDAALDLYFRQCSISVACRDLAIIAATLANGGVNPLTQQRAVREDVVRGVLSVMTTCGMYDAAGEWLVSVGLPAKSGVSGGVLAVLPGRLGIGVFSPRLDARGNSVRGVAVCRDLSRDLALHLVRPGERLAPVVRASYTVGELGSKRLRNPDQRAAIRAAGGRSAVFELQGELGFAAAEALSRGVAERDEAPELVVVDLRRVVRADRGGLDFLAALASFLDARGGKLALASCELDIELDALAAGAVVFEDLDRALEWCEDELLTRMGCEPPATSVIPARHELFASLTADELDRLLPSLGTVTVGEGELVVRAGEPASEVFLVTRGQLSVFSDNGRPGGHRLTTLSAGMTFGEVAFVERRLRSADVRADSPVECRTLSYAALDALAESDPVLHGKLLHNLLRVVVASLRVANVEVAHLTR